MLNLSSQYKDFFFQFVEDTEDFLIAEVEDRSLVMKMEHGNPGFSDE